jgi:hypothetical protein
MKRMPHKRKNCGVWIASFRVTLRFRDHRARHRRRRPSRRLPASGRALEQAGADQHDREVGGAERHDRVRHTDAVHEEDVEIAGEKGAAAEAHDGHPGGHAAAVGKPLHERADRRDVPEPAADAADDAHAQEHDNRLVDRETEAADDEPHAEEQRGARGRHRGTATLDPWSAERRAQAEQDKCGRECRIGRTEPPGLVGKQRLDRPVERAPGVDRSDADVNRNGSDRDAPAIGRHGGQLLNAAPHV